MSKKWLSKVHWDDNGLVPVIVQEQGSNDVLAFAFVNREALQKTVESGEVVLWPCSHKCLWHKGEELSHIQKVYEIRLDCNEDVVLLRVTQIDNIACHTDCHTRSFQKLEGNVEDDDWYTVELVLRNSDDVYASKPGHNHE